MRRIICSALALISLSVFAFSYGDNSKRYKNGVSTKYEKSYGNKRGKNVGVLKIVFQLDLTSDQITSIKEIKKASRENKMALKEKYSELKQATKDNGSVLSIASKYMSGTNFNKTTLVQLATDKSKARQEARNQITEDTRIDKIAIMADTMEKIFNVLTQEQRVKFVDLAEAE